MGNLPLKLLFFLAVKAFKKQQCVDYILNDFAIIHVKMESSSYLRRVQSLQYTQADKIGIIGGTLGLFTGFSFIFILESFYWVLIVLKNIVISKLALGDISS